MNRTRSRPASSIAGFAAIACVFTSACAGGSDRYPSLNIRDFERVQGQFAVAAPAREVLLPSPAPVEQVSQLQEAVDQAQQRHSEFVMTAESVRGLIAAAGGTGPDNNGWSLAQSAYADLDSRRGATAILLSELDQMYTSATLSFTEREQIDQARNRVSALVAAEDALLDELHLLLSTPPVELADRE
jgi:hypothetical protein